MSIVDSLNRMHRAGSKSSKTTQKLIDAAGEVANQIIHAVPNWAIGKDLPRGYRVITRKSNVGSSHFLIHAYSGEYGEEEQDYIDGTGSYLHGDFHAWIPAPTREGVLVFARDLANGLLDEIAEWLEGHSTDDEAATTTLQKGS